MRRTQAQFIFAFLAFGLGVNGCAERAEPPPERSFHVPTWSAFLVASQAARCRDHSPVRPARGEWIAFRRVQTLEMTSNTLKTVMSILREHFSAHRDLMDEAAEDCWSLAGSVEAQTLATVRAWRCLVMEPLQDGARRDLIRRRLGIGSIDWAYIDWIRTRYAADPRWVAALGESTDPCPSLDVAILDPAPPELTGAPPRVGRLFGDRVATFFIAGGSDVPQRGELHLGDETLAIEVVPLANGVLRGQGGDVKTGFRFEAQTGGKGRFNGSWSLGAVGDRAHGTLVIAPQPEELQSAMDK